MINSTSSKQKITNSQELIYNEQDSLEEDLQIKSIPKQTFQKQKLQELNKTILQLTRNNKDLTNQLRISNSQIEITSKKLNETLLTLKTFRQENDKLQKENIHYKHRIQNQAQKIQEQQLLNQQFQDELTRIQSKLAISSNNQQLIYSQNHEDKKPDLDTQNLISNILNDLKIFLNLTTGEFDSQFHEILNKHLIQTSQFQEVINQLQRQMEKYSQIIEEHKLIRELNTEELTKLEICKNELETQIEQLTEENQILNEQINDQNNAIKILKEEMINISKHINQQQQQQQQQQSNSKKNQEIQQQQQDEDLKSKRPHSKAIQNQNQNQNSKTKSNLKTCDKSIGQSIDINKNIQQFNENSNKKEFNEKSLTQELQILQNQNSNLLKMIQTIAQSIGLREQEESIQIDDNKLIHQINKLQQEKHEYFVAFQEQHKEMYSSQQPRKRLQLEYDNQTQQESSKKQKLEYELFRQIDVQKKNIEKINIENKNLLQSNLKLTREKDNLVSIVSRQEKLLLKSN